MDSPFSEAVRQAANGQPLHLIERDGVQFHLLGTAHVSRASADAARDLVATGEYDAVAIELCDHRVDQIKHPARIAEMDLFQVLREGKAGTVAAGLALSSYQHRLAKQFGIEPGAEMKTAMAGAEANNLPVWLIDRNVGTTMRRARAAVGFWERTKLLGAMIASVLSSDEVGEEQIENLKQGDLLKSTFTEFAEASPPLFEALIAERDSFMADRLRAEAKANPAARKVLAIVGAGHLAGIEQKLLSMRNAPGQVASELGREPPKRNWGEWIVFALSLLVLGGFVWAFHKSPDVGWNLLMFWVLSTGLLGALGALIARSHPLSILGAFLASPITPFHPALSSGMVSAGIELWLRKPKVADFSALKEDLNDWRGWLRNGVSRIFIVFFLTNLGTAIGFWIAGPRVFGNLFSD